MSAKWTRGEVARLLEEHDDEALREVVKYLLERGPRVVDWNDDRVPCDEQPGAA